MLPHSKVIVGAPDSDFLLSATGAKGRAWKLPGFPFEVGEDTVAPLNAQLLEAAAEIGLIVHCLLPSVEAIRPHAICIEPNRSAYAGHADSPVQAASVKIAVAQRPFAASNSSSDTNKTRPSSSA
jgi:hypothetical protein